MQKQKEVFIYTVYVLLRTLHSAFFILDPQEKPDREESHINILI